MGCICSSLEQRIENEFSPKEEDILKKEVFWANLQYRKLRTGCCPWQGNGALGKKIIKCVSVGINISVAVLENDMCLGKNDNTFTF